MIVFPWKRQTSYPIQLDQSQIKNLIKHRYPFLFLDSAEIIEENICVTRKCISLSDNVLNGHFPNYPVMPGVLQIEAMGQAACLLGNYHTQHIDLDRNTILAYIEKFRFYRLVLPGEVLEIRTEFKGKAGKIARFKSSCSVNGELVSSGEFKAALEFTEEHTLAIIKPDAFAHSRHIIDIIEANGLKIASYYEEESNMWIPAHKVLTISNDLAKSFYEEHQQKPFFPQLCSFMTSGPSVVFVLKGKDAISKYRSMIGATNPEEALNGTIRKMYGKNIDENAVHGSDSIDSATREIKILFPDFY